MSICYILWFSYPYIFLTKCRRLSILLDQIIQVYHQVAKMGLENLSLWQKLNSFNTFAWIAPDLGKWKSEYFNQFFSIFSGLFLNRKLMHVAKLSSAVLTFIGYAQTNKQTRQVYRCRHKMPQFYKIKVYSVKF